MVRESEWKRRQRTVEEEVRRRIHSMSLVDILAWICLHAEVHEAYATTLRRIYDELILNFDMPVSKVHEAYLNLKLSGKEAEQDVEDKGDISGQQTVSPPTQENATAEGLPKDYPVVAVLLGGASFGSE